MRRPTSSTRGMRCGGLIGWPTRHRSGWRRQAGWISLGIRPDEFEASTHVDGSISSRLVKGVLGFNPLRSVLLDEVGAVGGHLKIRGEGQTLSGSVGREPKRLQTWPGVGDEAPQGGLGLRRWVTGDNVKATRQEQGRPAGADHARADDGDPFHGLPLKLQRGGRSRRPQPGSAAEMRPRHSPKPSETWPSRAARARKITSSPSSRKSRRSPLGRSKST